MLNLDLEYIGGLIVQLKGLPQEIHDAEMDEWKFKREVSNTRDDLKQSQWKFENEVAIEQVDGKLKFSNQAKRDSEVKRRMLTDPDCVAMALEIKTNEQYAMGKTALLWQKKNEYSSLKTEINITAAVLYGLADPVTREFIDGK